MPKRPPPGQTENLPPTQGDSHQECCAPADRGTKNEQTSNEQTSPELQIESVVNDHYQSIYRFAFRLCGTESDALDLTQQTFLTAQRKLHQVRDPQRLAGWLFTVARNCFRKSLRKAPPLPAAKLALCVEDIPEPPATADQIDREQLQQAINQLADDFKLVIVMYYYENLSYKEIADQLRIPMGTVMSRLARAKQRLRSRLAQASVRADRSAGGPPLPSGNGSITGSTHAADDIRSWK